MNGNRTLRVWEGGVTMGRITHLELFHSSVRNTEPRHVVGAMLR